MKKLQITVSRKIAVLLLIIVGFIGVIIGYLAFPSFANDPNNCTHIVEINTEKIQGKMETETAFNLYNGSYSIDANFMIEKVGEEEYDIIELVNAKISNAGGYYIKDVEYCEELEELWIIVSNDDDDKDEDFPIGSPLKLDRTVKEVVVLEWKEDWEGPWQEQVDGEDFSCKGFLNFLENSSDEKPINKKGSIIIGSK